MAKNSNQAYKKKENDLFDIGTFLIILALTGIGLLSIYSATYESNMSSFFWKQILATVIGLAGFFAILYLPKRLLKTVSYYIYFVSLVLLVAVLFFGTEIYGTRGWLRIAGFSIQPAEVAKLGIIMISGVFLSYKGRDISTVRDFLFLFALYAVPMFLILQQPDFGTVTVVGAIFLGVLLWSGFNSFVIFGVVMTPVVIILSLYGGTPLYIVLSVLVLISILFRQKLILKFVVVGVFIVASFGGQLVFENLKPHQRARIETFLDPSSDPRGSGYNVLQSVMAVGSGGIYGKGYLQGSQTQLRYIPMQWTDFIFSVPTEEFGFIGGAVVIILFTLLIIRFIHIASESNSKFHSVLAIGIATMFIYHYLINVGMAIGLVPVMGIPLPYMSSGGTSMIINMMMAGLVMNIYRENKKRTSTYEKVSLYD